MGEFEFGASSLIVVDDDDEVFETVGRACGRRRFSLVLTDNGGG